MVAMLVPSQGRARAGIVEIRASLLKVSARFRHNQAQIRITSFSHREDSQASHVEPSIIRTCKVKLESGDGFCQRP